MNTTNLLDVYGTTASDIWAVGEAGTILRSLDGGTSWEPVPAPYEGSFFGLVPLADGQLLIHGLRGRAFRSTNGGAGWQPVATPVPTLNEYALMLLASLMAGFAGWKLRKRRAA